MPQLSDTMEEGKIIRWLKRPGDAVARDEALAEVETDKADMVLEAFEDGVLGEIKLKTSVGKTMMVTLSCDHRIVDGVVAGRFLQELKRFLENPATLLVQI